MELSGSWLWALAARAPFLVLVLVGGGRHRWPGQVAREPAKICHARADFAARLSTR